jgi:cardiolipin synthase
VSILSIPNLLTFFRLGASFAFLYYGLHNRWDIAFPIFWIAALTDMIDGSAARLLRQRTRLGAFLDPMADKLLMFFSFLSLTISHYLPVSLTCLIIARDLLIISGLAFLKFKKAIIVYRPTYLSKTTTFFQIATVFSALSLTQRLFLSRHLFCETLLLKSLPFVMAITAALTVATGIQYTRIGWDMLKRTPKKAAL